MATTPEPQDRAADQDNPLPEQTPSSGATPPSKWRRISWFVGLWAVSVLVLWLISRVIRWAVV